MKATKFVYKFGNRMYDLASRTHILGVLNVTPDSFSDGGKYFDPMRAVERALEMIVEGADIIDIGGESTRPKSSVYGEGAENVSLEEELRRVVPVIELLAQQTDIPISIDTYKSEVVLKAIEAGACIVNDISGFRFDKNMAETVARSRVSVVLMHTKGSPKTMQINPSYDDLFKEITDYLTEGIRKAESLGIDQIIVDPGLGFGKTKEHNLKILHGLSHFKSLGYPLLVGASRKNFIGEILDLPIEKRIEGSLTAAASAVLSGANLIRVHDVKETKYAVMVADAIRSIELN